MMTTPSIDIAMSPMMPESGVEVPSIPLEPTGVGVGMPSPPPEAIARFQSAMAKPLAENSRLGQLFADVVSSTRNAILPALGETKIATVVKPVAAPVDVSVAVEAKPMGIDAGLEMAKLGQELGLGQRASCPLGAHSSTGGTPVVPDFPSLAPTGGTPVVPVVCDMPSPTLRQCQPVAAPVEVSVAVEAKSVGIDAGLEIAKLGLGLGQRASCPLGTHSSTGGTPVVPDFPSLAPTGGTPVVPVSPSLAPTGGTPVVPEVCDISSPTLRQCQPVTVPVDVPVAAEVKPAEPPAVQPPEVPVVTVPVEEMPEPVLVAKAEREQPIAQEKKVAEVAEVPDTERVVAAGLSAAPVVAPLEMSAPIPTAVDGVAPVAALSGRDVPVQRMDVLVEAATAVADTLLVSPSLLRGEGEVLVQLKPDVLEGSQIRIVVSGKVLDVSFQTPTPDLAQMLVARLPELQQHLAAAVPAYSFNVKVGTGRTKWTPLNS